MLPAGPDARRIPPSQNVHVRNAAGVSVMYITDNNPQLAHNQGWREADGPLQESTLLSRKASKM